MRREKGEGKREKYVRQKCIVVLTVSSYLARTYSAERNPNPSTHSTTLRAGFAQDRSRNLPAYNIRGQAKQIQRRNERNEEHVVTSLIYMSYGSAEDCGLGFPKVIDDLLLTIGYLLLIIINFVRYILYIAGC